MWEILVFLGLGLRKEGMDELDEFEVLFGFNDGFMVGVDGI